MCELTQATRRKPAACPAQYALVKLIGAIYSFKTFKSLSPFNWDVTQSGFRNREEVQKLGKATARALGTFITSNGRFSVLDTVLFFNSWILAGALICVNYVV